MGDGVKARYEKLIANGDIRADAPQGAAVNLLDGLDVALRTHEFAPKKSGLSRFLSRSAPEAAPKGVYMWGGVGRGKSMLMDLFFDTCPVEKKKRVHFHAFMQSIHDRLAHVRATGTKDPLSVVAAEVVDEVQLLCFDELQITDITDAMIVGRLFQHLFDHGVVVVTTSNRVPGDLYKDGLNRKLFLPFIALIEEKLDIHHLDGAIDHRRERLEGRDLYFSPLNKATTSSMDQLWEELTNGNDAPLVIENKGRQIELAQFSNGVARVDFEQLCARALGPSDFIAVAEGISVLMLENIPKLSRARNNEAKRFVTLIDTLYEAKTTLIASAQAEPEQLYTKGEGAFEFERTASRLAEMRVSGWAEA